MLNTVLNYTNNSRCCMNLYESIADNQPFDYTNYVWKSFVPNITPMYTHPINVAYLT